MARRSRYLAYNNAIENRGKRKSSPDSILKKLREYKEQNVVISVPLGQEDPPPKQGGGGD